MRAGTHDEHQGRGTAMTSHNREVTRRALIGGASASAVALLLTACGGGEKDGGQAAATTGAGSPAAGAQTSAEQPRKGGTLKAGQVADVSFTTSAPWTTAWQTRLLNVPTHEPLVRYRDTLEPELVLAERFEYNADRTKLTVTLKPGLEFHNGAKVTVDDVFFGLDVLANPMKYQITGQGVNAPFVRFITDRKKLDERTMEFTFDRPRVNMTDFFASFWVTHTGSYERLQKGEAYVGTGPYGFKSYAPRQGYRMEANKNWWGASQYGGPYLDAIDVRIFADHDAAGLAFEAGDIEYFHQTPPSVAKRFQAKKQVRVQPRDGYQILILNLKNPMLQDVRVRQALYWAVDRQRFTDELGEKMVELSRQYWPKSSPAFDPGQENAGYDPNRAKDLLRQAGFSQSAPLEIDIVNPKYNAEGAILKQNFEAVGVKTEIVSLEQNAAFGRLLQVQFTGGTLLDATGARFLPLTVFQTSRTFRVGDNYSSYDSAEWRDALSKLETVDPLGPQAKELYARINKIMVDDAWVIPTRSVAEIDLVSDKLRGFDNFVLSPTLTYEWGRVWKKE
jgi:peptide/nickel transport system substrate-binding protein